MTSAVPAWVLPAALVLILVLLIVTASMGVRIRALKQQVTQLEEQRDVTAAVATHPKRPQDRLVGVVLNITKTEADETVRLISSACSAAGMPEPLVMTSSTADAGHLMTRRALDAGCDVVIAAGGDGTVRAVASELTGTEAALGVVPLGTGNLFARNAGLPHQDLAECVTAAIHGTQHRVDTLQLQLERPGGRSDREISLVIAGCGLDAEVMADTREVLKQRAGWLAYGEAGVRHVKGPRKSVTVQLDDDEPATFRVRSVLLANCGTLQGGVELIPSARFDDGHMEAVLFTPRHALDWARIVAKTVLRLSTEIPVMTVRHAARGRIRMAEPMLFQIDGDPVGEVTAVHAAIAPGSLVVNGVSRAVIDTVGPDDGAFPPPRTGQRRRD